MHVIYADNPDDGLAKGLRHLLKSGESSASRNGPVIVAPEPVTTVYTQPWNHVSFWDTRDANPFFHLVEAMWMLLGRQDVALPAKFAKSMESFSDDGKTLWGAYGYRWRSQFGEDQLASIAQNLINNPTSRREVLSMWDPEEDPMQVDAGGKDVPCNTHAYLWVAGSALHMTVCCRSNDIVWGAYGANVVHFSLLQQYLAECIGVGVGVYRQMSNNYHAYIERPDVKALVYEVTGYEAPPEAPTFATPKLLGAGGREEFLNDVDGALYDPIGRAYSTPFVRDILVPMLLAHMMHKAGMSERAAEFLDGNNAWAVAGRRWLARRISKKASKKETR
jgi:thymidylate synthase